MIPGHNNYDSFFGVRTARFHYPGKRSKEGDNGISCPKRFGRGIEWPKPDDRSGLFRILKPAPHQRGMVACKYGSLARMVIIILVSDSPDALGIEVWELFLAMPTGLPTVETVWF